MGCGPSTSASSVPIPIVPTVNNNNQLNSNNNNTLNRTKTNLQQNQQPQQQNQNNNKNNNNNNNTNHHHSNHNQQQHASALSPTQRQIQQQQQQYHQNEPGPKCDNECGLDAVFECEDCEEFFCTECDAKLHNRKKTKEHTRNHLQTNTTKEKMKRSKTASKLSNENNNNNNNINQNNSSNNNNYNNNSNINHNSNNSNNNNNNNSKPSNSNNSNNAHSTQPLPSLSPPRGSLGAGGKLAPLTTNRTSSLPQTSTSAQFQSQHPLLPSPPIQNTQTFNTAPQRQMSLIRKQSMQSRKEQEEKEAEENKVLNTIPIDKLRNLGMQQLNIIWNQYDLDGNGVLDKKELKLLASDCIERTLKMYEDELLKQNPNMSKSALKKAVDKEKEFLLPGKKPEDAHKEMTKMLMRKLDVNKDGSVTKTELFIQWNSFSKELFNLNAQGGGALECSIM